jgi:subfamily B ATP-binding cassette protein MsbA
MQLDDVYFAYLPGRPILHGISLTIEPGQMVGFVGPSGAGKTTLLNLLPRHYDPTSGAVKIDGHDLRHIRIAELRPHIAVVSQDNPIVPGTIGQNIAFGAPEASERDIEIAAQLVGADSFIEQLPEGYQTQVAEGGGNLSGGQRQRLALARALLCKAPVLVLDEPTSALDAQEERLAIQSLISLKGKRTIVLVSHRLETVRECDRIFVLDNGRIVERGTHGELLDARGMYYDMAKQYSLNSRETLPQAA